MSINARRIRANSHGRKVLRFWAFKALDLLIVGIGIGGLMALISFINNLTF